MDNTTEWRRLVLDSYLLLFVQRMTKVYMGEAPPSSLDWHNTMNQMLKDLDEGKRGYQG